MLRHAWSGGYAQHCWGKDELHPLSNTCDNGWRLGLTLIDSLDTLYLFGMDAEFQAARDWVADRRALDFGQVRNVNLFETTIRVLGGLLGAYTLSGDAALLERAVELGDRLLPAVRGGGTGLPFSDVDLRSGQGKFLSGDASTAEAATLGLEFKALSQCSGSPEYADAVDQVGKVFHSLPKLDGLLQTFVTPASGSRELALTGPYSLGSRGDSYYEYLLKQWLLAGRQEDAFQFQQDYVDAVRGIRAHLVRQTGGPLRLTYVGELVEGGDTPNRKMDHLVCFLPGLLALGVHRGLPAAHEEDHLSLAKELMRTCYEMYNASGTMLAPEIVHFDTQGQEVHIKRQDSHSILRPEAVESLFYLFRITGDTVYQDWGWQIAQAFERHAKVASGGYASLNSVLTDPPRKRDKMESFFLAETLKYLFLLFDDTTEQVPLDAFVFNTEGHPLRVGGCAWQEA